MSRRRVLLVTAVAVAAVAVAPLAAAAAVVRWPSRDHPRHADAIVVLSGDHGERLALAMRLLGAGVAHTLVLAGEPDLAEDVRLCQGGQAFEVVCLRPRPDSTRAEARATAVLAASRHWSTVVVATSTPHVSRSRLLFSRCLHGRSQVQVVGATLPYGGATATHAWTHEVFGLLYAWTWARGC